MEDSQLPEAMAQALQQPGATVVNVICYREPDSRVKRDEYLQIVRNAGCHVFYNSAIAANFMYIVPAGALNPLKIYKDDDDTYMMVKPVITNAQPMVPGSMART